MHNFVTFELSGWRYADTTNLLSHCTKPNPTAFKLKVMGSSDGPVNINQAVRCHIEKLFVVTILMSTVGVGLRAAALR